jgi:peptidylprolyl isomerase
MKSNSALGKTATLIIIVIIVVAALATYFLINRSDAEPPRYSEIIASPTNAGSYCTFSVLWTDNVKLSGYIFGSNNSGVFQNNTWKPFSIFRNVTHAVSEFRDILNETFGNVVQWQIWCNDTNNNWNTIGQKDFFLYTEKVLLRTNMGNIKIWLDDKMPITTGNFKYHVKRGTYDGTIFHRVIKGFMIQGGDPTGTGYGDPNIPAIPDEFTESNLNLRGFIAMANKQVPNTGSTQFFINLVDNNHLNDKHPVFGWVISGMDVVDAIGNVTVTTDGNYKPIQDVVLIKAEFVK